LKIQIIVDSTVDMPERLKNRVHVVPLTVCFGKEEFIDGVTIEKSRFYERLVESDVLPTTSQATPEAFRKVFEEILAAGDSAVAITISSKLSGTYQSACIAAMDFENVFVVDSTTAAIGSGILAEYALEIVNKVSSAKKLAEELERKREDVCLIALLDTLEYLKKGGRISKTTAFAGGILNIKPVLTVQNGEIVMLGKARGSRQGNNLLVEKIQKSGGIDFTMPILLGYSGLSDTLLKKYVEDSRSLWQDNAESLESTLLCSVIGTHTGPGVVAVAFFRNRNF
jgi:DegV family protein with EDD domain